jgi:hypothetical protein
MKKRARVILPILAAIVSVNTALVSAQTPTPGGGQAADPKSSRILGEVMVIDTAARQITLKTTDGKNATVKYDEKTLFRRVPAGEITLDKAVNITPGDVGLGDRVIARGSVSGDSIMARSLVVVSQADLAQKKQRERDEWKHRGVAGIITALNPATKEITISVRSQPATAPLIISAGGEVQFRRYAPESVRFSDAVESNFAALKVGDQLRALGNMSTDGSHFVPEKIVSATFQMIGGKITAVNTGTGEITVSDIQTQRPVTIVLNKDSMMRRLTPELLTMLEQQAKPSTPSTRAHVEGAGVSVQERIENLPPLAIADLKTGDAVLISSIKGANPARTTAVMLAAGVESYLKKQATRPGFTLDLVLPGAF